MSKRTFYNLLAVLAVVLILALALSMGGCTRYHVVKGAEGTPEFTEVSVWSSREFEAPDLSYNREEQQGEDGGSVEFKFGAASATQAPSPFEAIGAMAVQKLLDQMIPVTPADDD